MIKIGRNYMKIATKCKKIKTIQNNDNIDGLHFNLS